MKSIVRTTGDFSLRDTTHRLVDIKMRRPTVVNSTSFVQEKLSSGSLELLGVVNDSATQDELLAYLRDSGSAELAVAAFLAAFPVDDVVAVVEEVKAVETVTPPPEVEVDSKVKAKAKVSELGV